MGVVGWLDIFQQEKNGNFDAKRSNYLGTGWSEWVGIAK